MCKVCFNTVTKDIDIRDTDLPNLPFVMMKWQCIVEGCKCSTKVKDYGIAPFYYWPVRVRYYDDGRWRGGWIDAMDHWYMCSKHFKPIVKRQIPVPDHSSKACLSKIVKIDNQKK